MFKITGIQKLKLNTEFKGTEYCPYCDTETDFKFNPIKDDFIICNNCHEKIKPCSLCDSSFHCDNCKEHIIKSLLMYNDLLDDSINK